MGASAGLHTSRGELIDIGGRRLRMVRAGPRSARPLIVFECGAWGCAADWAVVQDRLAAKGLASLAYDRAGLGFSDAGPTPRDGRAIAADLEALLAHAGESGPLIMVGHSMAGLMLRVFTPRNRERVKGVVLVDAVTPDMIEHPKAGRAIHGYRRAMDLVGRFSHLGFMRPAALVIGDLIGLEGEASAEKRHIYGLASHAKWAAEEVQAWPETSAQGREPFDPNLPVAVVTAGASRVPPNVKAMQRAPARQSAAGYEVDVPGATHASLLGRAFADPIIAGIDHVMAEAKV
ncbi:alpha/beta fold hydrolase [Phenylobacterium aquaticum]|uniref:alpha/beta fold hydrolase n=1 Tax=Phenylobacterium aquaticum TaxID=1763816 RepID=UPI001F5D4046|nr:alpha/beta fold hydrolase [Phenylobacterium aquaticum]MCI3131825.1 alpha/beta fold hydrolase [Phenylobacterium aquaticum]